MQLVMGGVNGVYLRGLLMAAGAETERVDAAVAYATSPELFKWCWENEIPLRFWGRFDEAVPVSLPILRTFLTRKSGRYTCKLVRCFHPKVIWWRGFGAYIGSANLTQAAWYNNVEAGVFLTDEELSGGQGLELEALFRRIDREASPLTDELMTLLEARSRELHHREVAAKPGDDLFLGTDLIRPWTGLAQITAKTALSQQREDFLQEWISTLQTIRGIADIVSRPENRPVWIRPDVPLGAQADQFLHAHYYHRTFDGRRADYERHFEANANDPDQALKGAVDWWRQYPSGKVEEETLNEVAPYLRSVLTETALSTMTEDAFAELLWNVHASREYARKVPNHRVGLPGGVQHQMRVRSKALSRCIWRESAARGAPVNEVLRFILYGGIPDDVPHRMWDALQDPKIHVDMLGVSSLGEIVGWAMPDRFPPRNGRTSKSLRSLGHNVTVHAGA